jgi:drug/metabolite transporter superfamily protein YnfA
VIRIVRILGLLLIAIGVLVILSWLIEPLRKIWPVLFDWFRSLPGTIQFGLVIAAVGFLILFSSIIWERLEDRKTEGRLLDDD